MYDNSFTLQSKLKKFSDELAHFIYPITFKFPIEERFALADQIRRAAVSVPVNIYEGLARETDKEKRRYMIIAIASLSELKYEIKFAYQRRYLLKSEYYRFIKKSSRLSSLLGGFIKHLRGGSWR